LQNVVECGWKQKTINLTPNITCTLKGTNFIIIQRNFVPELKPILLYRGDFILDREIKAAIEYVPIWYQQLKKKKDLMMQADLNKLSIENTQEIIDKIRAEESANGNNESNNNTNTSTNNEKPSEPVVETPQNVQTIEAEDPTLPPLIAPTINTNQLQSINPNDLFSISIVKAPRQVDPAPTVEATTNSSDTSSNVNTIQLTQQKIEEESVPITDREKELLISLPKRECK
jgi:hypothetical protein